MTEPEDSDYPPLNAYQDKHKTKHFDDPEGKIETGSMRYRQGHIPVIFIVI
jgi:hypothetical protein